MYRQVCWCWFIMVFLETTVKHTSPKPLKSLQSLQVSPNTAFVIFQLPSAEGKIPLPLREYTRSSFTPAGLHQGGPNCSIPGNFSLWVAALLTFLPSTAFPELQQQCSPTGAFWEVDKSKFCTHTSTGTAQFRVRNSHILCFTIYTPAGDHRAEPLTHSSSSVLAAHGKAPPGWDWHQQKGLQRSSTRSCCSLIWAIT